MSQARRGQRLRAWMLPLLLAVPTLALAQATEVAGSSAQDAAPAALPPTLEQPAPPSVPWLQHFQDAARLHGVDAHLLQALAQLESNFNPRAISRSGAVGLMQLMPHTASSVGGLRGNARSLRQQLLDPATNVQAAARYVRTLMDTFDQRLDLVLAAYNAGVGRVHRAGDRVPANGTTPLFVQKVSALYASLQGEAVLAESASEQSLARDAVPAVSALP